ncbi:MAG: hypothetical protein KUG71_09770 [Porticoccaceae bacterium]|nr:hypothetical protein [Porticoccaceae bacterium]
MDTLNQIFTWLSDHEAGFSALAALVVIIGVTLSPLGAGLRGLLSRKDKTESGITQTAKIYEPDLSETLDTLNTPPSPITDKPSIAVLPFVNMSDDKSQEYFADGMTEDIITGLSCDSRLFVVARNSTFAYKGQTPDIREVGKELGVRYVLEGSIRPVSERLRITVQLIETDTGMHIWADKIDRPVSEIFDIQDEVVDDLVTTLCSSLGVAEGQRAQRARPENLQAWALCVQAEVLYFSQANPETMAEAEHLLRRATEIEPGYAASWALLAYMASMQIPYGLSDDLAKDSANVLSLVSKALRLAPNDPVVLGYCGCAVTWAGQVNQAIDYLERSLAINPNSNITRIFYGGALWADAKPDEGLAQLQLFTRRSTKDPYIGLGSFFIAFCHCSLNDFLQAEQAARNCVRHQPGFAWAYLMLAISLAALGRDAEVSAQMEKVHQLAPSMTLEVVEDFWRHVIRKPEQTEQFIALTRQAWPD